MKIQFKRNSGDGSSLVMTGHSAGEPIWFKDKLYIGSVGATAGGTTGKSAGDLIEVAMASEIPSIAANTLVLSQSDQAFIELNGESKMIRLPDNDPWAANYAPASHAHGNITTDGKMSTAAAASVTIGIGDSLVIVDSSDSSKIAKSSITFGTSTSQYLSNAGTWVNLPASQATINTITSGAASSAATAVTGNTNSITATTPGETVTIGAGNKWIITAANDTNNTFTLGHKLSDASGSAGTSYGLGSNTTITPGQSGANTFKVPALTIDEAGHVTAVSESTVTMESFSTNNQTITVTNTGGSQITFGANAAIDISGGSNIDIQADNNNNTITISNTYSYSHPTHTAHSATGGVSGTTATIPVITNDGLGHVSALTSNTLEFVSAPTSSNKVITENDISGIVGAMVYKGTVDGTHPLPTTGVQAGWTYVVAAAGTYASTACEVGDMIIAKDSTPTWNVINGENQVDNKAATMTAGASSATTLATVDGTDITAKVSVTAGSATIASVASDVVTLKAGVTQGTGTGTIANSTGSDITLAKVAKTGSYNDLSNKPTIPTVNNATLSIKKDTGTAVQVFSADESTNKTINVVGGTNISLSEDTTTANTYKLTIDHATPSGASAKSSQGGVSGNTLTIPTISTDAQGHVTGLTTATYTATPNTDEKVSPVLRGTGSYKILFAPTQEGTTNGQPTIVENTYIDIDNNQLFIGGQQLALHDDIITPGGADLTLKGQYSSGTTADTNGAAVFNANETTGKTLTITGADGIKTTRTAGTNAQTITVAHTNSVTAQSTAGLYKVAYDAQGHITSTTAVAASDITALGIPGSDTNDTYTFSTTATTGTFADSTSGSAHTITLTAIDGGTF